MRVNAGLRFSMFAKPLEKMSLSKNYQDEMGYIIVTKPHSKQLPCKTKRKRLNTSVFRLLPDRQRRDREKYRFMFDPHKVWSAG